ncbi:Uncharacterised protein [Serratia grimesii]|nr:Uncharacterised protein [Serratia grimesii]SMZ56137.1 Uncharacterised protein [Serratia grimesii]
MTQTLTTERLKELADPNMICKCSWDEYKSMARELLANRESQPVGFYTTVSGRGGVVWHNGAPADDTAIYTASPAPAVPKDIPESVYSILSSACGDSACLVADELWNACRAAMLATAPEGGN